MTEIKVNEKGQAFFDFDALEKMTSKGFVTDILIDIKLNSKENDWQIKVVDHEYEVQVFVLYIDKISNFFSSTDIYTFKKYLGYTLPKKTIWNYELSTINEMVGELNG